MIRDPPTGMTSPYSAPPAAPATGRFHGVPLGWVNCKENGASAEPVLIRIMVVCQSGPSAICEMKPVVPAAGKLSRFIGSMDVKAPRGFERRANAATSDAEEVNSAMPLRLAVFENWEGSVNATRLFPLRNIDSEEISKPFSSRK